jgi:hypothetical protein
MARDGAFGIDLYWLPLGAGGRVVPRCGRVYEAIAALLARRPRYDLYHSALEVRVLEGRYVIEMAPVPDRDGVRRGVAVEGPVGSRVARHLRVFRYEVRRWADGSVPDAAYAVDSPRRLTSDQVVARRLLELVPRVPAVVWGRDELRTGEMWNSNSVVSWLLARAGLDTASLRPPAGGRAPGWDAGLVVASREQRSGAQAQPGSVSARSSGST